jgi:hypothetical protein
MSSFGPLPASPVPSPRASEGAALTVAFLALAVAGVAAALAWSTTAGAVMLALAGTCFFGLYARGHLASPPVG